MLKCQGGLYIVYLVTKCFCPFRLTRLLVGSSHPHLSGGVPAGRWGVRPHQDVPDGYKPTQSHHPEDRSEVLADMGAEARPQDMQVGPSEHLTTTAVARRPFGIFRPE